MATVKKGKFDTFAYGVAAGIIGAAFAPMIAIWLAKNYGINFVGYYLTVAAAISFLSLLVITKKKHAF